MSNDCVDRVRREAFPHRPVEVAKAHACRELVREDQPVRHRVIAEIAQQGGREQRLALRRIGQLTGSLNTFCRAKQQASIVPRMTGLTRPEAATVALLRCGGDTSKVDTENVAIDAGSVA